MNAVVAAPRHLWCIGSPPPARLRRRLHRHRGGEVAEVQEDGGVAPSAFRQLAQLPAAITAGTESAATARAPAASAGLRSRSAAGPAASSAAYATTSTASQGPPPG